MISNNPDPIKFRSRVILLGASNLSSAISTIIRIIQNQIQGPIEFYLADGFGRSYGQASHLLARTLPGILKSELWPTLHQAHTQNPLPTFALITDIGNDLAYHIPPPQLKEWLEETINRLQKLKARIIITSLPLDSISRLSNTHYNITRKILFPSNRTTLDEMKSQMATVNQAIRALSTLHKIPLIHTNPDHYGFDPIHIKRSHWQSYYQTLFQNWHPQPHHQQSQLPNLKPNPLLWAYLWTRWPKSRYLLNTPHRRQQPAGILKDHSTISVY